MLKAAGRALGAALAGILAGCETNQPAISCALSAPVVLPLVGSPKLLTLDASINGMPAQIVLDTGAVGTFIARAAAPRFYLTAEQSGAVTTGVVGTQWAQEAVAHTFSVGAIQSQDAHFLIADLGLPAQDVALFGRDFLQFFDIDLDLTAGRILLYGFQQHCSVPSARMAQPMFALPLIQPSQAGLTGSRMPYEVSVEVNGTRLLAVVDTGATRTSMARAAAHRVGITDAMLAADRLTPLSGVGGPSVMAPVHVLPALQLGDLEVSTLPVTVLPPAFKSADMILGLDLMTRVHFWVSNASHRLILQFPVQPSPDL